MTKEEEQLPDGRRIIFYTFEEQEGGEDQHQALQDGSSQQAGCSQQAESHQ